MWDVQERDGHCEVATGQRPNPWKEDGDNNDDKGDDINSMIFGKKVIEHKMCFDFLYNFCLKPFSF
jgi:hypothetical protein